MTPSPQSIAISQSNYIPWKGYFDLIASVDEFVLYDEMQYTRRDWRNRNVIKTPQGPIWLTIPVAVKGKYLQKISETRVTDTDWAEKHWIALTRNYGKAPHFGMYRDRFQAAYENAATMEMLSDINRHFIETITEMLGIRTQLRTSSEFELVEGRTEKLLGICTQRGAGKYLSGPAAREYMDESLFARAGVLVEYMNYDGYIEYPQLHPPFDHAVSVLDLLFMTGSEAPRYMKHVAQATG
ncbi:MAG: WbqC family protein [Gemmatimonadaceae bacterium]|nr:WbqC family protein [Gemmatimonadaceae bacterium]